MRGIPPSAPETSLVDALYEALDVSHVEVATCQIERCKSTTMLQVATGNLVNAAVPSRLSLLACMMEKRILAFGWVVL